MMEGKTVLFLMPDVVQSDGSFKNAPFSVSIDDDYVNFAIPNNKSHIVLDSDEFCACELSDDDRRMSTIPRTSKLTRAIAQWAYFNTRPRHRQLLTCTIRLHAGMHDRALWNEAECESDRVVNSILAYLRDPDSLGVLPSRKLSIIEMIRRFFINKTRQFLRY